MKRPTTLIAVILLLTFVSAHGEKLGVERENLIGPVREVYTHTINYEWKSGKWVEVSRITQTDDYSETEEPEEKIKGEEEESDVIEEMKNQGYNTGYGTAEGSYGFYKVDERGNIASAIHYSSKKEFVGKDAYKYDAEGKEIEKNSFDASGKLTFKVVSRYDASGNLIEKASYLPSGVLRDKREWTYDTSGNVASESLFKAEKPVVNITYSYSYDRVGNWIRRVKLTQAFESKTQSKEVSQRKITYN